MEENQLKDLDSPIEEREIKFAVKEDFIDRLPEILSNIEQVKEWALEQTNVDRSRVLITNEDFAEAKKRCALLNRIADTIDEKRISVKKAYTEPYTKFENSLKDVTKIIKSARENLWSQIKESERQEKEEKRSQIEEYYASVMGSLIRLKPIDTVFLSSWLNRSFSIDSVKKEIDAIKELTEKEVQSIKDLHSENESALMLLYSKGESILNVFSIAREWANKKKDTDARKKPEGLESEKKEEEPKEEMIEIAFKVRLTYAKLEKLKEFLQNNKIEYGKV